MRHMVSQLYTQSFASKHSAGVKASSEKLAEPRESHLVGLSPTSDMPMGDEFPSGPGGMCSIQKVRDSRHLAATWIDS